MFASGRSVAGVGVLALLVGAALAAAVAGGAGDGVARAAVPRAIAASQTAPATGADTAAEQLQLGPEQLAALRSDGLSAPPVTSEPTTSAPVLRDDAPVSTLADSGIPATALQAYEGAAQREAKLTPDCGLTWPLLAGIGRVESDHGRFAGAVLHSDGLSTPPVIGIPLDGNGTALIRDTDGGRLDGDTVYDRAVGPMQFIPSTWAGWGVDANGDGVKDPFNIFDAAAAAADYLCAAGRDLTTLYGQVQAILSYNYSFDYVSLVMSLEHVYATQVGITVPVLPTSPEPKHGRPAHKPTLPPVDPGTPRGAPPPSTPSTSSPVPWPTASSLASLPSRLPRPSLPVPSSSPSDGSGSPSPTDSSSPTDSPSPTDPSGASSASTAPLSGGDPSASTSS